MLDVVILHGYVLDIFVCFPLNIFGICSGIQFFENSLIHSRPSVFLKVFCTLCGEYKNDSQPCVSIRNLPACPFPVILSLLWLLPHTRTVRTPPKSLGEPSPGTQSWCSVHLSSPVFCLPCAPPNSQTAGLCLGSPFLCCGMETRGSEV